MTFGHTVVALESCTSTQDEAKKYLAQPGTVVTAKEMSAGRGRLGRRWVAPSGTNLCATLVGPCVEPARLWELAPLVGLAAVEAVRALGFDAQVRFPNDLFLQGRKLGGVLIEVEAGQPLIGVGINVKPRVWPPELEEKAIALGNAVEIAALESALWEALNWRWSLWERDGLAAILPDWHALLDPEARRVFVLENQETLCKVALLSASGQVTLELPDRSLRTVSASEVIFGED